MMRALRSIQRLSRPQLRNPSRFSMSTATQRTRELLRKADCICFDVDSTVSTEEGIDLLAEACGKGEAVAEWTSKAMGGSVLFQDAIAARLDLMQPRLETVGQLLRTHGFPLTPGLPELVQTLKDQGKTIVLVSGGLKQLIVPIANKLDIPTSHIFAIELFFNADGSFKGFDKDAPTARTGGKHKVVQTLRESYDTIIMIGDGVTDLEAKAEDGAAAVIGFGGNVVREKVKQDADWFVHDMQELIDELKQQP